MGRIKIRKKEEKGYMAKQLNKSVAGSNINFQVGFTTDKTGINELKSSLVEIQRMTASDLMDLNKGMNISQANAQLKELRVMATSVQQALNSSFNKDLGTVNVTKFNGELLKTGYSLQSISKSFSMAGEKGKAAFRNLATEALTAQKQIKQSHNLIQDMANTMANTVKWGIASSAMNSFTGSVQSAYGFVKKLDTSLNNIRIVSNKSADDMERFAKQANKAAQALGSQTTAYTDAALIYYQQGLGDEETKARAETTVKTANVTGMSGSETSEALTAVWNGYQVDAAETEMYVDKLAAVAAGTAADLEELSTGMSKVASAANTAGVDIDQLNATLSTVISVTREAPEAIGTAFKTIYARMGDLALDGEDEYGVKLGNVSGKLHELGIEILDSQGQMRDMGTVMEETAAKWDTWTQAQKQAAAVAMAGKMQYSRLMALFENWDMYEKAIGMSKNSLGELQRQQDTYMESTQAHLDKMNASFEGLYNSLLDADSINTVTDAIAFLTNRVTDLVDGLGGGEGVLLNLGAIATRVFSKQISSSIATTVQNIRGMQVNLEDTYTQVSMLSELKGLNVDDEALQKIIELKETFSEYSALFTEEEANQADLLIKAKNEIQNQTIAWKENLAAAKEYYEQASNQKFNESELETRKEKPKDLTAQAEYLQNLGKDYKGMSKTADEAKSELSKLLIVMKQNEKVEKDLDKDYNKLTDSLKKLIKRTNDYIDTTGAASKHADELIKLKELQDEIFGGSDGNLAIEEYDNLEAKIVEYTEKAQQLYQQMSVEAEKNSAIVQGNAIGTASQLEQAEQKIDESIENVKTKMDLTKQVNSITQLAGSIGQLSTAISSLISLGNIWSSDDYTTGEKILKTVETMAFTLPMVISGFKGIKANAGQALLPLATQLGAVSTAEGVAATTADIMWTSLLWPVAIVLAALATVGVAIYAIVKAYNADAEAAKQAAEQAKAMTERYEELKTVAEELKTTISDYNDAIKQMETLDEKTEEYASALEKANSKAKELIETYKLYDDYYMEDGAIKFKDGVLDKIQQQADTDARKAEGNMYSAKIASNQANLKSKATDLRRSYGYVVDEYDPQTDSYSRQFTNEELTKTGEALNSLREKLGDEYDIVTSNNEKLKEAILSMDSVPDAIKENIDAILDDKSALLDFANSMKDATEANKYYTKQIMGSMINEKYGNTIRAMATEKDENGKEVVNEARAKQLTAILAENQGKNTSKMNKELEAIDTSNINWNSQVKGIDDDKDLALTYANEVLGYKDRSKLTYKGGWNKGTVKDETGKNIVDGVSDDVMRREITRVRKENEIKEKYSGKVDEEKTLQNLQHIMDGAKKMGEDYGTDFTDAILNSITNNGKIDLSGVFAEIQPSEFLKLTEMSPEDLQKAMGLSKEDLKTMGFSSATEFAAAFKEGLDGYEWDIDKSIDNSINKKENDLKKNNIDKEEIEDYTKQLMNMAEADDFLADTLKEDSDSALEVAKTIMIMNDGIEELAKNWEDWNDILKNSSKTSEEYAEALGGVRQSVSKILGVEEKALSNNFLETHLKDIEKAANGDEDAIESLRKAAQDDIITSVLLDSDFTEEKIANIKSQFDELEDKFAKVELGVTLNGDDELVKQLQNVIDSAEMTEEEANSYLQSIGMEPTYSQEEIPETKTIPEYTVTPSINMEEKKFGIFGKHNVPTSMSFKVTQSSVHEATGKTTLGAVTTNGTTPKIKTLKKVGGTGTAKYNNYSSVNKGGPSPSGKSGGEPSKKDLNEDIADRYEKVNVQLNKLSAKLTKLQSQEDKLFGSKLVDNWNKQIDNLNKTIDKTNEKLGIAKDEQTELQNKLAGYGIKFDGEGVMSNYMQVFAQQQAQLNAVYNHYNSLSTDAQKGYEATVEAAEKRWEKFKDAVTDYDTLIGQTIPGLEQAIQDAADEQIALRIKEFDMEIDLALDIKSAEDKWNEFKKRIIDDIKDDDILGNAAADLVRGFSFYNDENLGVIQEEMTYLNNLMAEIDKYNSTGWSDWYGDDENSMMEDLQKYYEQAMDDMEEFQDIVDEIHDALNATLEDVADQMEDQLSYYETISDTLEHDMKLVQLVYGEEAYGRLALYYQQQENNLKAQLDFQSAQVDFWKKQLDTLEEGSEAWETAKENWLDAVGEWQSAVETSIENLQDKFVNAINEIFQNLNDQVTNGSGLDFIDTEWELINKNADQYLDTINAAYGIQQLQNKYLDAIDKTDSLSAQRKLNELMNEQVDALKEQDKLSQYDLDRANLKYEIALKRIALEEAQQNKSTMRLKRDSQGNYTYQYVSDEDEVKKLQDDLSNLYNQLYNMDTDRYTDNLGEIYDIWVEFQERMAEAAQINDPEKRLEKEKLLTAQYGELINGLVAQNETIKQNLYESTFLELEDLYGHQSDVVQDFLENQDEAMEILINGWSSGLQEMADEIFKEGGFEATYEEALERIKEATEEYEEDLEELQEAANVTFESLGEDIDETQDEVQQLIGDTAELNQTFQNEVDQIQNIITQIDNLKNKYSEQAQSINTVTEAYNNYIDAMKRAETAAANNANSGSGAQGNSGSGAKSGSGSGSGSGGGASNPYSGYRKGGQQYSIKSGDTLSGIARAQYGNAGLWTEIWAHNSGTLRSGNPNLIYPGEVIRLNTGGYTGDWSGNNGKMAMLDQKELVLNKQDTENILNTVEIMRNLTNSLGSSILKQISNMTANGFNLGSEFGGDVLEQDVHIDATFPNVSNSNEIENALNNLVNAAAQRVNKR